MKLREKRFTYYNHKVYGYSFETLGIASMLVMSVGGLLDHSVNEHHLKNIIYRKGILSSMSYSSCDVYKSIAPQPIPMQQGLSNQLAGLQNQGLYNQLGAGVGQSYNSIMNSLFGGLK